MTDRPHLPDDLDHPALRELARTAEWVAQLEDAAALLGDLWGADPLAPHDEASIKALDSDPLGHAFELVEGRYEDDDAALEEAVATWLEADPEHWHIFRLLLLKPWSQAPGSWRPDVPRWVLVLCSDATSAHFGRLMDEGYEPNWAWFEDRL